VSTVAIGFLLDKDANVARRKCVTRSTAYSPPAQTIQQLRVEASDPDASPARSR
jgi:hypothetical protein